MELQDEGFGPKDTENFRLKLVVINQEIAQLKGQGGMKPMGFESQKKMAAIEKSLEKAVASAEFQAALRTREEAAIKLQNLEARKTQYETRLTELPAEEKVLRGKITEVLQEGGDPTEINRQLRILAQEQEDLAGWVVQLKTAILYGKSDLNDAEGMLWVALGDLGRPIRDALSHELSDYLAQASEVVDSWRAAIHQFSLKYQPDRGPGDATAKLRIDEGRCSLTIYL
ncbi:MAG: hypothetical protein ACHQ2F_01100 [Desulfobaccales bacterium]